MIKFVCGFLLMLRFPPPIKLAAMEIGIKHLNPNPYSWHVYPVD
jgi:hypothetical protein